MTHQLRLRPASTPAMLAVFGDDATVGHALTFEAALALAQAAEGVIEQEAADAVAEACKAIEVDTDVLAEEAALAGTLAIPLVARLRAMLTGSAAASVHHGATSQDLADSVLMIQARAAAALLAVDLERIARALTPLARRHAATAAMGRTLLRDALPIGLGLRIAHWHAGIADAATELARQVELNARLQLGGAVGTRAGMNGRGEAVAARVADALGLAPSPPWHARRGGVAALAAALGILLGVLGKMARDVAMLGQDRVGEVQEPAIDGRGGSSAMPHKRNPAGAQVALAAAHRAPGLVAAVLAALPAEQERGLGGWQAEGPVLVELFMLAGGSAAALATVAEGLEIDLAAVARNAGMPGQVADLGESAAIVSALIGREG